MTSQIGIDAAIFEFVKAYSALWKEVQCNPNALPSGSIGCGSIAEHDAKKYLEFLHPQATINFAKANQKSWDIEVVQKNGDVIKYQVKSISVFNKGRRTSNLVKGFDRLIVLSLGDCFVPEQAFLFDDASVFWRDSKIKSLIVPNPTSRRKTGSNVFYQHAIDIKDELLDAIS